MRSRVELFEQIRRDWEFEGVSTHALARKYGVYRRTVRHALMSPVPPARKRPEGRAAPKLGEWRELIDSWLIADRDAPRKQRHTAKRIHKRLRDEHGVEVCGYAAERVPGSGRSRTMLDDCRRPSGGSQSCARGRRGLGAGRSTTRPLDVRTALEAAVRLAHVLAGRVPVGQALGVQAPSSNVWLVFVNPVRENLGADRPSTRGAGARFVAG
jgi:hypothetical protein